jgi:membrane associated rhomboid family serine protease
VAEAGPELSVVCKSCGSEVSPYVTECPYCGTRLRKRAPKLERVGDEVRVREGRRDRRRRRLAERRSRLAERRVLAEDLTARPLVTIFALAVPAIAVIVVRASNLTTVDLGAIVGPVGDEWWRYLAAPFVYDDLGYLFACGLAIAIFLPPIERRVGSVATLLLVLGTGALGMLAANGLDTSFGDGVVLASGGNGIALGAVAAYAVMRDTERRADPTDEYDRIAVAVAAIVLLLLPVVEDYASVWAGLVGGLVGAACGLAAALGGRTAR